jgi:hypothetical protein
MDGAWQHDMQSAPRGGYRIIPTAGGKSSRKVWERETIIGASACGAVHLTWWLPEERRWSMYQPGSAPIAWMPYAGPETVVGEDGKARNVVRLPAHPTKATSWFQDWLSELRAAA